MDGHEGYLEHEWAAKTLQRLESIANPASPEHKAAGKVLNIYPRASVHPGTVGVRARVQVAGGAPRVELTPEE
jgi:hypothetical protein